MTTSNLRQRYVADSVEVMSPARIVVALYDRLWMDLHRGAKAVDEGAIETANRELTHAQRVVEQLQAALDTKAWPGARNLHDLYSFVLAQLVTANVKKDRRRIETCIAIVEPLRDAWKQAARDATGTGPALGSVA